MSEQTAKHGKVNQVPQATRKRRAAAHGPKGQMSNLPNPSRTNVSHAGAQSKHRKQDIRNKMNPKSLRSETKRLRRQAQGKYESLKTTPVETFNQAAAWTGMTPHPVRHNNSRKDRNTPLVDLTRPALTYAAVAAESSDDDLEIVGKSAPKAISENTANVTSSSPPLSEQEEKERLQFQSSQNPEPEKADIFQQIDLEMESLDATPPPPAQVSQLSVSQMSVPGFSQGDSITEPETPEDQTQQEMEVDSPTTTPPPNTRQNPSTVEVMTQPVDVPWYENHVSGSVINRENFVDKSTAVDQTSGYSIRQPNGQNLPITSPRKCFSSTPEVNESKEEKQLELAQQSATHPHSYPPSISQSPIRPDFEENEIDETIPSCQPVTPYILGALTSTAPLTRQDNGTPLHFLLVGSPIATKRFSYGPRDKIALWDSLKDANLFHTGIGAALDETFEDLPNSPFPISSEQVVRKAAMAIAQNALDAGRDPEEAVATWAAQMPNTKFRLSRRGCTKYKFEAALSTNERIEVANYLRLRCQVNKNERIQHLLSMANELSLEANQAILRHVHMIFDTTKMTPKSLVTSHEMINDLTEKTTDNGRFLVFFYSPRVHRTKLLWKPKPVRHSFQFDASSECVIIADNTPKTRTKMRISNLSHGRYQSVEYKMVVLTFKKENTAPIGNTVVRAAAF